MRWIVPIVIAVLVGAIVLLASGRDHRVRSFTTVPFGQGSLPRADAWCAERAAAVGRDPRPANRVANRTAAKGAVSWSMTSESTRWAAWMENRSRVTGRFRGTTNEMFTWAGCKWGLDENLLRAVAAQESDWTQSKVGDGGASFGLMQIKDHYADGAPAWGGFPDTLQATGLNVDFYAAYLRSCLDGDFYDGGRWLYRGHSMEQVLAAHGSGYAVWGCVGSWFSGDWHDASARAYVAEVRRRLLSREWPRSSSS